MATARCNRQVTGHVVNIGEKGGVLEKGRHDRDETVGGKLLDRGGWGRGWAICTSVHACWGGGWLECLLRWGMGREQQRGVEGDCVGGCETLPREGGREGEVVKAGEGRVVMAGQQGYGGAPQMGWGGWEQAACATVKSCVGFEGGRQRVGVYAGAYHFERVPS